MKYMHHCIEGTWKDIIIKKRVVEKEGVTFFRGLKFLNKNKLKSEIFNDKKCINQKCFSVITKNLNWEILTKDLVTLKMGWG